MRQNQFQVSAESILRLSDIRMQLETFVCSRSESRRGVYSVLDNGVTIASSNLQFVIFQSTGREYKTRFLTEQHYIPSSVKRWASHLACCIDSAMA